MTKIFRQSSKTRGKIYTQTLCHLSLLLKKPILAVLRHTQWSTIGNAPPYLFAFFTLIICLPMNHSWGFHTRSIQADKMTLKQTLLQHFYSNSEHPFTNIWILKHTSLTTTSADREPEITFVRVNWATE